MMLNLPPIQSYYTTDEAKYLEMYQLFVYNMTHFCGSLDNNDFEAYMEEYEEEEQNSWTLAEFMYTREYQNNEERIAEKINARVKQTLEQVTIELNNKPILD